ncbi:MAG: carbohydrate ABC transporter permease [bacterium]
MEAETKISFSKGALYLLAVSICIPMILPFLWMFLSSFKSSSEIIRIPPTFIPERPILRTYITVLRELDFIRYFVNSIIVSTAITAVVLFTSSLVGFVFAKFRFPGREAIFLAIISTMMIPFAVVVIPLYLLMAQLRWVDRYIGLIVPMFISAFGIFLMRQFIDGIPMALLEAAKIDGANEWWMYFRVVVPLSKSAFSALGIFVFMWSWNNLFWPLIVTVSPEMRTLTLGVATLQWEHGIRYDVVITGAAIATIPVLIVYSFAHKNFVKGLTLTGLKY